MVRNEKAAEYEGGRLWQRDMWHADIKLKAMYHPLNYRGMVSQHAISHHWISLDEVLPGSMGCTLSRCASTTVKPLPAYLQHRTADDDTFDIWCRFNSSTLPSNIS